MVSQPWAATRLTGRPRLHGETTREQMRLDVMECAEAEGTLGCLERGRTRSGQGERACGEMDTAPHPDPAFLYTSGARKLECEVRLFVRLAHCYIGNRLEQCWACSGLSISNMLIKAVQAWVPPFPLPPCRLPIDSDGWCTNLTITMESACGGQTTQLNSLTNTLEHIERIWFNCCCHEDLKPQPFSFKLSPSFHPPKGLRC